MQFGEHDKCSAEVVANNNRGEWGFIYWLLGTLTIPITLPLVIFRLWRRLKVQKFRRLLPGKVVLITGASSGLGEALAHVFYKASCKVILAARRLDQLERVKSDLMAIEAYPISYPPTVMALDLAELNDIPGFVERALGVHNQIDILINNGGISVRADVASASVDVDVKVMLVNYFGAVALTKAVLPSMSRRGVGHICFISSVQGKFALPYRSAYSASKHAMQAFSDSLRAEVASKGIKVTCISPGYINTQLSINALTSSGISYGKMDKTTANGMNPKKVAMSIITAILRNENDLLLCDFQAKMAYYVRTLLPSVYFWIMEKRAAKLLAAEVRDELTTSQKQQLKKKN